MLNQQVSEGFSVFVSNRLELLSWTGEIAAAEFSVLIDRKSRYSIISVSNKLLKINATAAMNCCLPDGA